MSSAPWKSICFGVALLLASRAEAALTAEALATSGDSGDRIDLVILAEGYTADQRDKALADARATLNGVDQYEPFLHYRGHFNWWFVFLTSAQAGADHPSQGLYVNTALDASFDYNGIERLLVVNNVKAYQAAFEAFPQFDYLLALVNDPQYGGSGGEVAVVSLHLWASAILAHEFGHTHGGLADEYTDAYPGYPAGDSEPNVTYQTGRSTIPWRDWILPSTPLPTPNIDSYDDVVGLFEGARYLESGIYRPAYSCLMRTLDAPLCEVCREAMALANYRRLRLVESTTPYDGDLGVIPREPFTLTVTALYPDGQGGGLTFAWSLDGAALDDDGPASLTFDPSGLAQGAHFLSVLVEDATGAVLNDPDGLSAVEATWAFTLTGSAVEVSDGDAGDDLETIDIADTTDSTETADDAVEASLDRDDDARRLVSDSDGCAGGGRVAPEALLLAALFFRGLMRKRHFTTPRRHDTVERA